MRVAIHLYILILTDRTDRVSSPCHQYAGGKRFVMVRKILQVKEVGRVQAEEYLARQWQNSQDE